MMKTCFFVVVMLFVVGCAGGNQQREEVVEGLEEPSAREMEMEGAGADEVGAAATGGVANVAVENILVASRTVGHTQCACSEKVQREGKVDDCKAGIETMLTSHLNCERAVIEKSPAEFHAFSECMVEAADQYATCMQTCNAATGAAGVCDTEVGSLMQQCTAMLSPERVAELDACM